MAITASVADYLEAIMMLQREKTHVRSIDIANHFGYSRPTVSQTLKSFRAKGYVEVDEDGHVCLTDLGKEIAQTTYEKHVVLTGLLSAMVSLPSRAPRPVPSPFLLAFAIIFHLTSLLPALPAPDRA